MRVFCGNHELLNGLVELFILKRHGQLQNCRCGTGRVPAGWRGAGGPGHVHPTCVSGSSGFACPAQAAMACWLMKADFDCANLRVPGYGVESGLDELVLLLWRAAQPGLGSGLAGVGSGCLRCFRLCPLLFTPLALSYCSYHKAMAAELPLCEGTYNTAMSGYFGAHLKPSSLPLTLPNFLNFQPLFLPQWHWCTLCIFSHLPPPPSLLPACV